VDDLKSSHKDLKVSDQFDRWLQKNYGAYGEVTIHQGKIDEYLGMEIDYSMKGKSRLV
jgi:hypothetical protein